MLSKEEEEVLLTQDMMNIFHGKKDSTISPNGKNSEDEPKIEIRQSVESHYRKVKEEIPEKKERNSGNFKIEEELKCNQINDHHVSRDQNNTMIESK